MPNKPPPKASALFEEAFRDNTGTIWATCELCGLTIFTVGSSFSYEKGELEGLRKKAQEHPEKYAEWTWDGVSLGRIDGKIFIRDHDCPELGKYESFVWSHRFQIAEYLRARAKEELDEAQGQADRIGDIGGEIRRTRPGS